MSDREDRRYQQAEVKIRDAFMALMEGKGFENMSATDIIKRAGVNRTTFYAHYRDKYDLLDAVESEFWEPLAAYISGNTGNMLTEEFFRKTITEIIYYYYENREMLRLLTRSNNDRFTGTVFLTGSRDSSCGFLKSTRRRFRMSMRSRP